MARSFQEVLEHEAGYCLARHRPGQVCKECAEKAADTWLAELLADARGFVNRAYVYGGESYAVAMRALDEV